jgi:uroporphyrinogen-III synthase
MHTPPSTLFDGLRVAIFEGRMANALADLVAKQGGIPVSAPSLRELPIQENSDAQSFADGLVDGAFDVVIFETGVGVRYLVESLGPRLSGSTWKEALSRTKLVARGPKPASALRELGARIDLLVPEPNTWRETLAALDANLAVKDLRIAVQEYGKAIPELTEALEQRGALVTRVPVYRWGLPEDTNPLRDAVKAIADRQIGAALFTAAQQVEHVLQIAADTGIESEVLAAFAENVVVGSIGPTTSAALRAHGLPVDIEPAHPKSGHLVAAVATSWRNVGKVGLMKRPGGESSPKPPED